MRKDKSDKKRLSLYTEYYVTGLNINGFINALKNRGISLYDIKKISAKKIKVTVNYADNEKFFAISKELCYNVKKTKDKGKLKFGLFLFKNFGILLGAFIFTLFSAFSGDFVFSVDYLGNGKAFYRIAEEYLNSNGVGVFSRFSALDLDKLSAGLTAYSDKFSFAECVKYGNRLRVTLVKAKEDSVTLKGQERLVSDAEGTIISLSVYRGTAVKNVGDRVNIGDVLIDGYATIKERTVNTGAIGVAVISAEYVYSYSSLNEGEENIALFFAMISAGDKEFTGSEIKVSYSGDEILYSVTVTYRRILYSG